MNPTTFSELSSEVSIPDDGTMSRTVFQDARVKVVLFGFAPGQELSEHTAAFPAILHFLEGEAHVTLGPTAFDAKAGAWVHMPAGLPHSIRAISATKMLLLLLKGTDVSR